MSIDNNAESFNFTDYISIYLSGLNETFLKIKFKYISIINFKFININK